jgi:hypothetical protein
MSIINAIVAFFKVLLANEYVRRMVMAFLTVTKNEGIEFWQFLWAKVAEAAGMPISFEEKKEYVFDAVKAEYGHLSTSDINTYLEMVWKTMTTEEAQK